MSFAPPPGSTPPKSNTGLIVTIVVSVLVFLLCCPMAVFVAFRPSAAADILKAILGQS